MDLSRKFMLLFSPNTFVLSTSLWEFENWNIQYKPIILPVVLYGWEAWCLTLREECRLRIFENRILRRIFGSKREENWEYIFHIVRLIKPGWLNLDGARHMARMEEDRSTFNNLTGKPKGMRSLGRPRHRWEGNVTLNLKEIGVNTRNCFIQLTMGFLECPCE